MLDLVVECEWCMMGLGLKIRCWIPLHASLVMRVVLQDNYWTPWQHVEKNQMSINVRGFFVTQPFKNYTLVDPIPPINSVTTFMSAHKHSIHQLKTSWKIRDHPLISQLTHSKVLARSIWPRPILWSHPPPMWSQVYLTFYANHIASMSHCRLNLQNEHTAMLLSIRVWYSLMAWWILLGTLLHSNFHTHASHNCEANNQCIESNY